jgi:hypothetical protein
MTRILTLIVLAVICVAVADDDLEAAKVHVALVEYDLVDQCRDTAEVQWAFLTRSELPETVLEKKVSDVRCKK